MELSAARARAMAIAATGAVAVFGSVAIQGAHGDLLAGLENAARDTNAFTDVWVAPAGSYNLLQTAPFAPTLRTQLQRLPGVRAVGLYRSGLLDYGERRVLVIAPPRDGHAAAAGRPARAGRPAPGDRARARGRLAGALAGARRRTPPAHRRGVHAAEPRPADVPRGGALDQPRLGAGRDRDERLRLRARVGQRDASAYSIAARPRRHAQRRAPARSNARCGPRTPGSRCRPRAQHAARQSALSRQALAQPHSDRHADPDRRGAGDGGGDGRAGLAAPPAPGEAQARGAARARNCGARSCWRACCCSASAA